MKISQIAFNDTADLQVVHPVTGEDLTNDAGEKITVTLYGTQSQEYKRALNVRLNKNLKRGGRTVTAEQADANALELITACVKSVNNYPEGEDIKQMLIDAPWLRDQIDTGIGDASLFLQSNSQA